MTNPADQGEVLREVSRVNLEGGRGLNSIVIEESSFEHETKKTEDQVAMGQGAGIREDRSLREGDEREDLRGFDEAANRDQRLAAILHRQKPVSQSLKD